MGWIKVPEAHHPLFHAALPRDARVSTAPLFGGVVARVRGHIFAGLFARSVIVNLSERDRPEALALDGAGPFAPMGDGRVSRDKIMLPESVMDEPDELRGWIARAFAHVATLPPKTVAKKKQATKKPAAATTTKKPAASTKKQPAASTKKQSAATKKRPAATKKR